MPDKAIADYTATEAAQEITRLAGQGTRIDLLAGQLLILTHNAQTRLVDYTDSQRIIKLRMMNLAKDINKLLINTHGKKTIKRQDLDTIYRVNKI